MNAWGDARPDAAGGDDRHPTGGSWLSPGPPARWDGAGEEGTPSRRRRNRLAAAATAVILAVVVAVAGTGLAALLRHRAGPALPAAVPAPGSGAPPAPHINVAAVTAKVDPGLVDINSTFANQGGQGAGTGMVLTSSGLVLTNNHVIANATAITVQPVGGGRSYAGHVVGDDPSDDVAVVQMEGASGLKTVTLGDSSHLSVGQPVVAVGNALGRGGPPSAAPGTIIGLNRTVTAGDPGSLPETLTGLIETDADIQLGDSGGPLADAAGRVVGMDTAAAGGFRNVPSGASAAGFAIPIASARTIADEIRSNRGGANVQIGPRAYLGIKVTDMNNVSGPGAGPGGGAIPGGVAPVSSGAVVVGVVPGQPAAAAGLSAGDVIVSLGGRSIASATALTSALGTHHPGDKVNIGWVTPAGANRSAAVTLGSGPPA